MSLRIRALAARLAAAATVALLGVSSVSAETLLMPSRDAQTTQPVVVWGVHTNADGHYDGAAWTCALSFGDEGIAVPPQNCTGVDRSYIAYAHTYSSSGTYTVRLTVTNGIVQESATTTVQVFDPSTLSANDSRNLGVNMTIQDGLRFLWTSQDNRAANFPGSSTTSWSDTVDFANTSLVVQAFQNQGYKLTANVLPTGIFEKYIIRRGLNFVLSNLSAVGLGTTPAGNDPCVGTPAPTFADCVGLAPPYDTGYTTALSILSFAGSGALAQVNTEVGGTTAGMTYGEVLQRLVNALAWGQNDTDAGQGGWDYNFNSNGFDYYCDDGNGNTIICHVPGRTDGSTVGWDILALLDAKAAGATVPDWVATQFGNAYSGAPTSVLAGLWNSDGSFDYTADGDPSNPSNPGPQKAGIGLQGFFLIGETAIGGSPRVAVTVTNIDSWWNGGPGIGRDDWFCGSVSASNKGCAYSMFNNFKGLKLQNIATLPSVSRPAGPGSQPANDWYADYQDWFVANQTSPTDPFGGYWGTMGFSCCASGLSITAAIAELILAPVALVPPDPVKFSTIGLSPASVTNPVGGNDTVTATTLSANDAPVPGVTIDFKVISGPNTGKSGSGVTVFDGTTTFMYQDSGGGGIDTIQAFIGTTISSNKVFVTWHKACDFNNDNVVNAADLLLMKPRLNTVATGPTDPFDVNHDGVVNILDYRYCQLRLGR